MADPRFDVFVIGAGVSGLTTAVRIAEAGLSVRVFTRDLPWETTSVGAGAIWGPYLADHGRVAAWSMETLNVLEKLAGDESAGVRLVPGMEASRTKANPPAWAAAINGFRPCEPTNCLMDLSAVGNISPLSWTCRPTFATSPCA